MQIEADENKLREQGYINAKEYSNIPVSYRFVSKLHGVCPNTIINYANAGYIKQDVNGMISLAEALTINIEEIRYKYLRER